MRGPSDIAQKSGDIPGLQVVSQPQYFLLPACLLPACLLPAFMRPAFMRQ